MRLLSLLFFVTAIYANHISWLGSYDDALKLAKKEHKPLMVLLVKKECKKCNDFIVDYFTNRDYIPQLNDMVVSVIVTHEGSSSYPIELFYSTTFPTLFLVDSSDESFLMEPFCVEP
ncbi:hypothetical protein MNB_SV-6-1767 [hydrothermal vent metagenome]|uniref:DUF255 domain-containing protein n=1 Tax=hydrothermal vent metagenome TaxID=652676 RepID=A0A1W1BYQ8_9ZZZZ